MMFFKLMKDKTNTNVLAGKNFYEIYKILFPFPLEFCVPFRFPLFLIFINIIYFYFSF